MKETRIYYFTSVNQDDRSIKLPDIANQFDNDIIVYAIRNGVYNLRGPLLPKREEFDPWEPEDPLFLCKESILNEDDILLLDSLCGNFEDWNILTAFLYSLDDKHVHLYIGTKYIENLKHFIEVMELGKECHLLFTDENVNTLINLYDNCKFWELPMMEHFKLEDLEPSKEEQ